MEIETRKLSEQFCTVIIRDCNASIDLGTLGIIGRKALANVFINAAEELLSGLEGKDNV